MVTRKADPTTVPIPDVPFVLQDTSRPTKGMRDAIRKANGVGLVDFRKKDPQTNILWHALAMGFVERSIIQEAGDMLRKQGVFIPRTVLVEPTVIYQCYRRPGYLDKFPCQATIRNMSGFGKYKTVLDAVVNGETPLYIYGETIMTPWGVALGRRYMLNCAVIRSTILANPTLTRKERTFQNRKSGAPRFVPVSRKETVMGTDIFSGNPIVDVDTDFTRVLDGTGGLVILFKEFPPNLIAAWWEAGEDRVRRSDDPQLWYPWAGRAI